MIISGITFFTIKFTGQNKMDWKVVFRGRFDSGVKGKIPFATRGSKYF
jgi:hypothetical protein